MSLYLIIAGLQIWSSFRSFLGGISYLRYFKKYLANGSESNYLYTELLGKKASIIVPCRGMDKGLEENLLSLFNQDFPNYEIIFVVDCLSDDAVSIIEKLRKRHEIRHSKLVVAGEAAGESQKIWNLRKAIEHVDARSEFLVFADSDARMRSDWLKSLILPLLDPRVGATTGYRWFVSEGFDLSSEICSVWNASIASALGPNQNSNFCWGGSMALSREVFEACEILRHWRGALSDDFVVTNVLKRYGKQIVFIPAALTVSLIEMSPLEVVEFTTRQMKITRVYALKLWMSCLLGSTLFTSFVMLSLLNILYFRTLTLLTALCLSIVLFCSVAKSVLRLKAVSLILKDESFRVYWQFITHSTLWIASTLLYLYNSVVAIFSRRITWRGIRYRLISQHKIEIITGD